MPSPIQLPPTDYLNECFTYDPEHGTLYWKERPLSHFKTKHGWARFNQYYAAKPAGHRHYHKNGRPTGIAVHVSPHGKYQAHRIIYALMGIDVPFGMEIDHKDCDPFNNKWSNFRLATRSQNSQNTPKDRFVKNQDLPKGVSKIRGRFKAQLKHHGHQIHIGNFDTVEEAAAAYMERATEIWGEFARFN